mgnify:FL=1
MCLIDYLRTACATQVFGLVALAIPLMASDAAIAQANAKRSADAAVTASNDMRFKRSDRVAALESIQYALSELGDGASYVWHRGHGKLSGVIQPTQSFLDTNGRVCRHVVVLLSAGPKSKKTEAVACRLENGVWRFDS